MCISTQYAYLPQWIVPTTIIIIVVVVAISLAVVMIIIITSMGFTALPAALSRLVCLWSMLSLVHLPPRVSFRGHLTSAFRVPRSSGTRGPRAGSRISCSYWNMMMKSHVNNYLISSRMFNDNVDGLLRNCSNSIANALELLQSYINQSIYWHFISFLDMEWYMLSVSGHCYRNWYQYWGHCCLINFYSIIMKINWLWINKYCQFKC